MSDRVALIVRFAEKCEELRRLADADVRAEVADGKERALLVKLGVDGATRVLEAWMGEQMKSDKVPDELQARKTGEGILEASPATNPPEAGKSTPAGN